MRKMSMAGILAILAMQGFAFAGNAIGSVDSLRCVPTFECIGLYLNYSGDDNGNSKCEMQYRKSGTPTWKKGHDLWVDRDRHQYRGSLVHLEPNAPYEIRLQYLDPDGGSGTRAFAVKTWSDNFPVGKVTTVSNRNTTLSITESGTPTGYHVFQPAKGRVATIDVDSSARQCIMINANYVIVRGMKLMDPKNHGITIGAGKHDIVIEDCEITNWGPAGMGADIVNGQRVKYFNYESASGIMGGVGISRIVIQHNRIHHPRGCSNAWRKKDDPGYRLHPNGPQTISFNQSAGHHVIRYNHLYSDSGHYYNDVIGGGSNPQSGNMKCDTDIYGNIVSHCWDDGLEIEGYNENVRIWGNVLHHNFVMIGTACVGHNDANTVHDLYGPMYIWRNVMYEAWHAEGVFGGNATKLTGKGPLYFYHNTISVPFKDKVSGGLNVVGATAGTNTDCQVQNFTGKNNIFNCNPPASDHFRCSPTNHLDYNMYTKSPQLRSGWGGHKVVSSSPQLLKQGTYSYYLKPGSPGSDHGQPIHNFNDGFAGTGPAMGACELGAYMMKVGPHADAKTASLGTRLVPNGLLNSAIERSRRSTVTAYDIHGRTVQFTSPLQRVMDHRIRPNFGVVILRDALGAGRKALILMQ